MKLKFEIGLREDYTITNIYDNLQKSLHLTDCQMQKTFPDICIAKMSEEFRNMMVRTERETRLLFKQFREEK